MPAHASVVDPILERKRAIAQRSIFAKPLPALPSKTSLSSSAQFAAKRTPVDPDVLKKERAIRHSKHAVLTQAQAQAQRQQAPQTKEAQTPLVSPKPATPNKLSALIDYNSDGGSDEAEC